MESEQGSSTGLNRQVQYEKLAAGSLSTVGTGLAGNSANAQLAARAGSSSIIARRKKAFSNLPLCTDLTTAKVDMLSKITTGTYGIILVNGQLMIGHASDLDGGQLFHWGYLEINDGAILELQQKFFDDVYVKLVAQQAQIVVAVKRLLVTWKKAGGDNDKEM
ncbi:unnamed protein product [Cyclocybe aegerita]|uniref:Uncharacterized protein n=1 Tax=Cyclocybe aegerita TaxID=1973307 RepID=A0A8S0VWW4_CYCAE|nr:unnamed protein product [Cyclocybe aegerita]